jgi:hypothetical protein
VFDATTLEPLGHFVVHNLAHRVSSSPDGRTLFLAQAAEREGNGCCALFALRLATGELCRLVEPAMEGVPSPEGRRLFTQRGNMGIEVFDAHTLAQEPRIEAPGIYQLLPSPDGRWLFGVNAGERTLDVFDLKRMALVRQLSVPPGMGAWLGDQFYFYAHDGTQGNLWTLTPETTVLPSPQAVLLPGPWTNGQIAHQELLAGGERLFLYTLLGRWLKLDPRQEPGTRIPGGVFAIEPGSGKVVAHLAPSIDFAQVVASTDGQRLYGLDSGTLDGKRPARLLALDATRGIVLEERVLEDDVWSIALAKLPNSLIPRGEVQPVSCDR